MKIFDKAKINEPFQKTKKLWNMILRAIPLITIAFETVPKRLVRRLEE